MHALWHRFTETRIFCECEEPVVNCSSFTNTCSILISNGSITIYVPRAFQRAAPRPLILQHVVAATANVRTGRNPALYDIRFRRSSFVNATFSPAYKTLGIFIICEIVKLPRVL